MQLRQYMNKWLLFLITCFFNLTIHASPLPAAEVFKVGLSLTDATSFEIYLDVKPNYFLYSDRIKINVLQNSSLNLGKVFFPPTSTRTDKQGLSYPIYRNRVSISVPVLADKAGQFEMKLYFQGCSDKGFCYAPEERNIVLDINQQHALSQVYFKTEHNNAGTTSLKKISSINTIFTKHNIAMTLLIFYGLGVILSLTPCILPMVPVLSGIIIGHGKSITTLKAFLLSLTYVLSMSITYALIGLVVVFLGANIQINMQSAWAISFFSLIFVALACSMFDFYEFKLPQSWQTAIGSTSRTQKTGHYLGVAAMGCLSTLILSPCVTAPLIGVLTYIAQTKNVIMGFFSLFAMGIGMGTPLLLIGTTAGKYLPESGAWMNAIKNVFGILFIAIALYLMSRIIPAEFSMFLWSLLLLFSGIYSGAFRSSSTHYEKFCQVWGLIFGIYGVLILIGLSLGNTNPIQPLKGLANTATSDLHSTIRLKKITDIKKALKEAQGSPVMLDFYADWCTACKIMDNTTFQETLIITKLKSFTVLKIDLTEHDNDTKEIMNFFKIIAPPTFVFYDAQGNVIEELKTVGEVSTTDFLKILESVSPN